MGTVKVSIVKILVGYYLILPIITAGSKSFNHIISSNYHPTPLERILEKVISENYVHPGHGTVLLLDLENFLGRRSKGSIFYQNVHPKLFMDTDKMKSLKRNYTSIKYSFPLHVALISLKEDVTGAEFLQFKQFFMVLLRQSDENNGIIRRDKDVFIFLVEDRKASDSILLSDLKNLLKWKISIYKSTLPNSVEISTVSPYVPLKGGSDRGQVIKTTILTDGKYSQPMENIFLDFTWNFYGFQLQMAVSILYKPIYEAEVTPSGKVIPKRGFFHDFSETIYSRLNFTTRKFLCSGYGKYPPGAVTGTRLENGTWVGCLGDIVYNRADITVVAPNDQRFDFAEFLPRFEYVSIAFVTRQPHKEISWKSIYRAYTPLTWGLTVSSITATTIVLWVGKEVWISLTSRGGFRRRMGVLMALGKVFFDLFRILLCQDVPLNTDTTFGGKYLLLLFVQCSFILSTAYNSKLTALLTIPEGDSDIPSTFQALNETNYFALGAPKLFLYGIGGELLRTSKNPMMRNIYSRMEQDVDGVKCLKKAQNRDYACLSWNFLLDFDQAVEFGENNLGGGYNSLQDSKEVIYFIPLTQVIRKGAVMGGSYGYFMENLYEMGLMQKWANLDKMKLRREKVLRDNLIPKMDNASTNATTAPLLPKEKKHLLNSSNKDGPTSFELVHLKGTFIILLAGLLCSLTFFVLEQLYNLVNW